MASNTQHTMESKAWAAAELRGAGLDHPEFSLQDIRCFARVSSVYDGDTMTVIMPIHRAYYRVSVRLAGIDTCEMKSRLSACKDLAYRARNRLFGLVTGRPWAGDAHAPKAQVTAELLRECHVVWLECHAFDKYGRVLVTARADTPDAPSFADVLVAERLAYRYDGEAKLTEEAQLLALASKN